MKTWENPNVVELDIVATANDPTQPDGVDIELKDDQGRTIGNVFGPKTGSGPMGEVTYPDARV